MRIDIVRAGTGLWLGLFFGIASMPGSNALGSDPSKSPRPGYAGDATCVSCHRSESASYVHTAHHLTSQLPSRQSILGSFRDGTNTLTIMAPDNSANEPALLFKMNASGEDFFETAITGFGDQFQQRSERIDLVTGSGKRGQTYLYWQGDRLFELPVSYWTEGGRWINSPGYADGTADFSRPVHPGCMECHASYLEPLSPDPATNRFRRDTFVPGISCETCHSPGATHVSRRSERSAHSPNLEDEGILNPARMPRERQVDLCAVCHSGIQREPIAPVYSYIPGKPLSEFFKPMPSSAAEHPDVHGNQVSLLRRSRCYVSSPAMTCSTCHNTHSPQRAAASYSDRCLTCHRWESCGVAQKLGHTIAANCIDCHMPIEPTTVIVSETGGKETRATMRNHWIKIYPNAHLP
jgi:hypothetical protein